MKEISADILRIIDANINRLGEGLRVLEEFARLSLNDSGMTRQLKDLRHKLVHTAPELQKRLIGARNAAEDVGKSMDVPGEEKAGDASATIIANSRRVQESLRVMEELAGNRELGLDSEDYRKARFDLYTVEKNLLGGVTRREKAGLITGLYVIIDTDWLKGRHPRDITRQVIKGGANVIQLRCKSGSVRDFYSIAVGINEICAEKGIPFIINDSLEVALACGADGLHIGQEDLPVKIARRLLPLDMLLGVSVRTVEEAVSAEKDGADYLGAGAVFDTRTKNSAALGLKVLKQIKKITGLPLAAIGGINKENIGAVMEAGADAAAVISAVLGAEDVEKATRQLAEIIGGQKSG